AQLVDLGLRYFQSERADFGQVGLHVSTPFWLYLVKCASTGSAAHVPRPRDPGGHPKVNQNDSLNTTVQELSVQRLMLAHKKRGRPTSPLVRVAHWEAVFAPAAEPLVQSFSPQVCPRGAQWRLLCLTVGDGEGTARAG